MRAESLAARQTDAEQAIEPAIEPEEPSTAVFPEAAAEAGVQLVNFDELRGLRSRNNTQLKTRPALLGRPCFFARFLFLFPLVQIPPLEKLHGTDSDDCTFLLI